MCVCDREGVEKIILYKYMYMCTSTLYLVAFVSFKFQSIVMLEWDPCAGLFFINKEYKHLLLVSFVNESAMSCLVFMLLVLCN